MDKIRALAANQDIDDGRDRAPLLDERRCARDAQRQVELERLAAHQRRGAELLGCKERQTLMLEAAKREVERWIELQLCSQDYIDRWSAWLALPPGELVERMCSEADGWGPAMRQNSPFGRLHKLNSP